MSYRTIIVELQADRFPAARLIAARALAQRFGAALVGTHVMPPPFVPALWEGGGAVYLGPEIIATQTKAIRGTKRRAKALFEEICGADPAATWREDEGEPGRRLAEAARSADLVITTSAQATSDAPAGLVEALLTTAGVPVLVLPPSYEGDGGHAALVGWDGSREATRAVHAALPFLQEAHEVVLCSVGEPAGTGLEDAALMLQRHGVQVQPEQVAGSEGDAGEILMARAVTHGADLLVMGAYGHTRLGEFVFDGATRDVLRKAVLPVLFGS
jgi:nucleotide-binding universal stress UspA family protein